MVTFSAVARISRAFMLPFLKSTTQTKRKTNPKQVHIHIVLSDSITEGVEGVTRRCSVKKQFLNISQNSQQNSCAGVSF